MPEAAEIDDDGDKPFVIPSGETQEPSDEAKKALGLSEGKKDDKSSDPDQQKTDQHGQKIVDKFSAKVQEKSEELYATEERIALRDPLHLDKLLASGDKIDRRNAEKILQRNAEKFGASTVDAYKLAKAKKEAGDDPIKQKLAEVDHEIQTLKGEKRSTQWKEWKLENSIKGDLSKVADDVYSEYPDLPFVDVLNLAKGRAGVRSPAIPGKQEASSPVGGGYPTVTEEIDPALRGRFRIRPETEKFAREYFQGV